MTDYEIRRGDIFWVERECCAGSEQRPGRPAVVVSNNLCNRYSPVVEVVYLTTKREKWLPTHVTIKSSGRVSTALCEQIHSISKESLGDYIASCDRYELGRIDRALAVSLAI